MPSNDTEPNETERPKSARRVPEDGRKVWAEAYPGGDVQIEVGFMSGVEELYLLSDEVEALREVLEELDDE